MQGELVHEIIGNGNFRKKLIGIFAPIFPGESKERRLERKHEHSRFRGTESEVGARYGKSREQLLHRVPPGSAEIIEGRSGWNICYSRKQFAYLGLQFPVVH